MKQDIRLYFYKNGGLKKIGNSRRSGRFDSHFFSSLEECEDHIEKLKNNNIKFAQYLKKLQFVIVEYLDIFQSKIIKVI